MSLKEDKIKMVSENLLTIKNWNCTITKNDRKSESNRLIIKDPLLEGHEGHNLFGGLPYMFFTTDKKIVKWRVLATQKLDFCPNTPSMFEKGASLNICTQPQ